MNVNVLVETQDLTREEWLNHRKRGLGGSDISAILGLSPWNSAVELWLNKTGQKKDIPESNEAMEWGSRMEAILRDYFTEVTNKEVIQIHAILQHPEIPYLLADIDGLTYTDDGEPAVLELKTVSAFKESEWSSGVPAYYEVQIRHYLMVTGLKKAYCLALFGGNHAKIYEIDADESIEEMLLQEEKTFWSHVVNMTKPPMDASDAAKKLLDDMFKGGIQEEVVLPEQAIEFLDLYLEASVECENAKEKMQYASNNLKEFLGDYNSARCQGHMITWKPISTERLNSKLLKEEMPEIYAKYTQVSVSRRFSVR